MDDCIIIGAGPAGLTAAIYLARFHLSIRMFDCGSSRAAMIPRTYNHAGYPGGIAGKELLARMRQQTLEFGVAIDRTASMTSAASMTSLLLRVARRRGARVWSCSQRA